MGASCARRLVPGGGSEVSASGELYLRGTVLGDASSADRPFQKALEFRVRKSGNSRAFGLA